MAQRNGDGRRNIKLRPGWRPIALFIAIALAAFLLGWLVERGWHL